MHHCLSGNHMNNWKCVSVLKGDGTQASELPAPTPGTIAAPHSAANVRYFKLGAISHPNQVPWH